jgi:hypothetical protein
VQEEEKVRARATSSKIKIGQIINGFVKPATRNKLLSRQKKKGYYYSLSYYT